TPIRTIQRSISVNAESLRHCCTSRCIGTSSGSQWFAFIVRYSSYAHTYRSGSRLNVIVPRPPTTRFAASASSAFDLSRRNVRGPIVYVCCTAPTPLLDGRRRTSVEPQGG